MLFRLFVFLFMFFSCITLSYCIPFDYGIGIIGCLCQKCTEISAMQCVTLRNVVCFSQKCSIIVFHSEMQCVTLRNADNEVCYTQKCSVLHSEMQCVTLRNV